MKNFRGFSTLEIILVIILLGILAAYSVPYFGNFLSLSERDRIMLLEKNLRNNLNFLHTKLILSNSLQYTGDFNYQGETISFIYGYPAANAGGIVKMLPLPENSFRVECKKNICKWNIRPDKCNLQYQYEGSQNSKPLLTTELEGCDKSS